MLLALCPLQAQDHDERLYRWSVAAVAASHVADVHSSWGGIEANPVLGRGQRYGWRATSIKVGVAGVALLIQRYVLKRHPRHARAAAVTNLAMAGATAGIAAGNYVGRSKR